MDPQDFETSILPELDGPMGDPKKSSVVVKTEPQNNEKEVSVFIKTEPKNGDEETPNKILIKTEPQNSYQDHEFSIKSELQTGHTSRMQNRKRFRCESCPNSFAQEDHLRIHNQKAHARASFKCEHCKRTYKLPSTFARSLRPDGLRVLCPICDRGFALEKSVDRQVKVSHSVKFKSHQCKTCVKKLLTEKELINHETAHAHVDGGPSSEATGSCLAPKEKRTSGNRSAESRKDVTYKCENCELSNAAIFVLSGEQEIKCRQCAKIFTLKRKYNETSALFTSTRFTRVEHVKWNFSQEENFWNTN